MEQFRHISLFFVKQTCHAKEEKKRKQAPRSEDMLRSMWYVGVKLVLQDFKQHIIDKLCDIGEWSGIMLLQDDYRVTIVLPHIALYFIMTWRVHH